MKEYLTNRGWELHLRALAGQKLTFNKVMIGNGERQDPKEATGLSNPLATLTITNVEIKNGYLSLSEVLPTSDPAGDFYITEHGVFAEDPDNPGADVLYSIGFADHGKEDYVESQSVRHFEMKFQQKFFVGDSKNITANINEALSTVSRTEFEEHIGDKNNPHKVTKEDVGLGKVPNVSTENQTPKYDKAEILKELVPGEKLSAAFGKIAKAVSTIIAHIENTKNPHKVKAADIGAAEELHTHNAVDINRGILPIIRGGTGVKSEKELAEKVASNMSAEALSKLTESLIVTGVYEGNGEEEREIELGFSPKTVYVAEELFGTGYFALGVNDNINYGYYYGGIATKEKALKLLDLKEISEELIENPPPDVISVSENGFRVSYQLSSGFTVKTSGYRSTKTRLRTNESGKVYRYIAFR